MQSQPPKTAVEKLKYIQSHGRGEAHSVDLVGIKGHEESEI